MISHEDQNVAAVGEEIAQRCAEVAKLFKPGARVTLLVRRPSHPDGSQDAVITENDLAAVIAALRIRADALAASASAAGPADAGTSAVGTTPKLEEVAASVAACVFVLSPAELRELHAAIEGVSSAVGDESFAAARAKLATALRPNRLKRPAPRTREEQP